RRQRDGGGVKRRCGRRDRPIRGVSDLRAGRRVGQTELHRSLERLTGNREDGGGDGGRIGRPRRRHAEVNSRAARVVRIGQAVGDIRRLRGKRRRVFELRRVIGGANNRQVFPGRI